MGHTVVPAQVALQSSPDPQKLPLQGGPSRQQVGDLLGGGSGLLGMRRAAVLRVPLLS